MERAGRLFQLMRIPTSCVTGCPEQALRLVRRRDLPEPAPTVREMNFTILEEKGKLEDFLPLVAAPADPGPPKGSGS